MTIAKIVILRKSFFIHSFYRRAKLPEGADQKTMLLRKTVAKNKTFDSSISPSGLLERLVLRQRIALSSSPPTLYWCDDE
jgi:hypothetical protein